MDAAAERADGARLSLSEGRCIWITDFKTFAQAREAVETWVEFYITERPHQALGYKSPAEYGAHFGELVDGFMGGTTKRQFAPQLVEKAP
ncbi:hypothetical protein EA187_17445 [Lujinxingia sediminis]|uniref:Integrase catalytic domain-containing protein n=1 Tax=Lujinxingia sediminis TaxID=2480984 RepID=A0ABY0CPE8_9DELT|nr:hypothetical protein EA187_17445 [Lujinxingia sediminis]